MLLKFLKRKKCDFFFFLLPSISWFLGKKNFFWLLYNKLIFNFTKYTYNFLVSYFERKTNTKVWNLFLNYNNYNIQVSDIV